MLLIDGSNLLWRQVHSNVSELTNSQGIATGPVHGFMNSLQSLVRKSQGKVGVVVAWDKGVSAYRRSIYGGYKQKQDTGTLSPEELSYQAKLDDVYTWSRSLLHQTILPLTGSLSLLIENVEADDVIAWIALNTNCHTKIVSSDKDYLQLIGDNVSWTDAQRNKVINTKEELIESWDLIPDKYQEHLLMTRAMAGDPSDRIPGIHGIGIGWGNKIARKVLLDEPLDLSKTKHRAYLENKDIVERNMKLMTLLDPPPEIRDLVYHQVDLYSSLEINSRSWETLQAKLHSLELNRARRFAEVIIDANLDSNYLNDIREMF